MAAPGPGVPPEPRDPWGRSGVYPADGEAIPQPWSWPLGGFHSWPDSGVRAVPGRWLWVLGTFPLARGVSGAGFDCEKNGWAGQCCCILLLPCGPCLLSFVWVPSCSDLSPSLRWLRLCGANALPGYLIKRREDVFQKSPASCSAWSALLSWWRGEEASAAFS